MECIIKDRDWLYATLVKVKASTVADTMSRSTPATHGTIVDPDVQDEVDIPRIAANG